mgnify:CR=1 FL=1
MTVVSLVLIILLFIRFIIDTLAIHVDVYNLRDNYSPYIYQWVMFFLNGITLLVAAMPEGISLSLTLSLINVSNDILKN